MPRNKGKHNKGPSRGKRVPRPGANVTGEKRPKRAVAGSPLADDPTVVWGLSFVDLDGPWGWNRVAGNALKRVLRFLCDLESMRPGEVFGPKHKLIPVAKLAGDAQKRLQEIELDDLDGLWELRLSGRGRIWGHRKEHVFYPVWWDPEHEVCPSTKKHT